MEYRSFKFTFNTWNYKINSKLINSASSEFKGTMVYPNMKGLPRKIPKLKQTESFYAHASKHERSENLEFRKAELTPSEIKKKAKHEAIIEISLNFVLLLF